MAAAYATAEPSEEVANDATNNQRALCGVTLSTISKSRRHQTVEQSEEISV